MRLVDLLLQQRSPPGLNLSSSGMTVDAGRRSADATGLLPDDRSSRSFFSSPPSPTVASMAACDRKRFGSDAGLIRPATVAPSSSSSNRYTNGRSNSDYRQPNLRAAAMADGGFQRHQSHSCHRLNMTSSTNCVDTVGCSEFSAARALNGLAMASLSNRSESVHQRQQFLQNGSFPNSPVSLQSNQPEAVDGLSSRSSSPAFAARVYYEAVPDGDLCCDELIDENVVVSSSLHSADRYQQCQSQLVSLANGDDFSGGDDGNTFLGNWPVISGAEFSADVDDGKAGSSPWSISTGAELSNQVNNFTYMALPTAVVMDDQADQLEQYAPMQSHDGSIIDDFGGVEMQSKQGEEELVQTTHDVIESAIAMSQELGSTTTMTTSSSSWFLPSISETSIADAFGGNCVDVSALTSSSEDGRVCRQLVTGSDCNGWSWQIPVFDGGASTASAAISTATVSDSTSGLAAKGAAVTMWSKLDGEDDQEVDIMSYSGCCYNGVGDDTYAGVDDGTYPLSSVFNLDDVIVAGDNDMLVDTQCPPAVSGGSNQVSSDDTPIDTEPAAVFSGRTGEWVSVAAPGAFVLSGTGDGSTMIAEDDVRSTYNFDQHPGGVESEHANWFQYSSNAAGGGIGSYSGPDRCGGGGSAYGGHNRIRAMSPPRRTSIDVSQSVVLQLLLKSRPHQLSKPNDESSPYESSSTSKSSANGRRVVGNTSHKGSAVAGLGRPTRRPMAADHASLSTTPITSSVASRRLTRSKSCNQPEVGPFVSDTMTFPLRRAPPLVQTRTTSVESRPCYGPIRGCYGYQTSASAGSNFTSFGDESYASSSFRNGLLNGRLATEFEAKRNDVIRAVSNNWFGRTVSPLSGKQMDIGDAAMCDDLNYLLPAELGYRKPHQEGGTEELESIQDLMRSLEANLLQSPTASRQCLDLFDTSIFDVCDDSVLATLVDGRMKTDTGELDTTDKQIAGVDGNSADKFAQIAFPFPPLQNIFSASSLTDAGSQDTAGQIITENATVDHDYCTRETIRVPSSLSSVTDTTHANQLALKTISPGSRGSVTTESPSSAGRCDSLRKLLLDSNLVEEVQRQSELDREASRAKMSEKVTAVDAVNDYVARLCKMALARELQHATLTGTPSSTLLELQQTGNASSLLSASFLEDGVNNSGLSSSRQNDPWAMAAGNLAADDVSCQYLDVNNNDNNNNNNNFHSPTHAVSELSTTVDQSEPSEVKSTDNKSVDDDCCDPVDDIAGEETVAIATLTDDFQQPEVLANECPNIDRERKISILQDSAGGCCRQPSDTDGVWTAVVLDGNCSQLPVDSDVEDDDEMQNESDAATDSAPETNAFDSCENEADFFNGEESSLSQNQPIGADESLCFETIADDDTGLEDNSYVTILEAVNNSPTVDGTNDYIANPYAYDNSMDIKPISVRLATGVIGSSSIHRRRSCLKQVNRRWPGYRRPVSRL